MKAVGLYEYLDINDPKSLLDIDIPMPSNPTGKDLLIQIDAISVNPVDVKVRAPKDKTESPARILGWDAAGTVIAIGDQATLFKPGDKVFYAGDITRPGSNAQYQLVDERIVGIAPTSLTATEAAVLPLTALTAYEALFERMGISREGADAGKSILIIGGAGGVGSIAIQLAKTFGKLHVIASASRPESESWVRNLGADAVVNHHEDLSTQLKKTPFPEVDYIFILSGTDAYFPQLSQLIAPFGKITSITETKQSHHLDALKTKSATFSWEFMFTHAMFKTKDMIKQHHLLNFIAQSIDQRLIKTTLTHNLGPINATNLKRAHHLIEAGHVIGKLALAGFST
ncbi:MAG: zinc-binding alcohol dehydrogenase family protein [Ottowia sp.]|nr:zinc-binding alcohol dehydrogenase family protein [Ottowia sp.]